MDAGDVYKYGTTSNKNAVDGRYASQPNILEKYVSRDIAELPYYQARALEKLLIINHMFTPQSFKEWSRGIITVGGKPIGNAVYN